jgi:hypothetical protein
MNPNMGAAPALIVGLIAAVAVSALAVIVAFAPAAHAFVRHQILRRDPDAAHLSDRLAFGITTSATGIAIACSVIVYNSVTHARIWEITLIGWALVGAGSFFTFTAWWGATKPSTRWASLWWGMAMVGVGIMATIADSLIRWPQLL